jgi:polysaccharide deacetylase family protein (PEP-CTERM system associated)
MSQWDSLPSRVERNFQKLLDILDEHNSQATCFFLGWVAERFPHLVREAVARGHEIASHGYSHVLVCHESADSFSDDVVRSRSVLQDISGQPVLGYRAPGFSVTTDTPWFFEKLMDAGYRYDSSVFPGTHGHGGLSDAPSAPYEVEAGSGFVEFPVSVEHVAGRAVCFFGGGYLRLFPYSTIRHMAHRVLAKGRPVVFYIHPREIDSSAPRLPMSFTRRFRSYVNLGSTEPKLRNLLSDFPVTSFREFMAHQPRLAPGYQEQAGALVAKQA